MKHIFLIGVLLLAPLFSADARIETLTNKKELPGLRKAMMATLTKDNIRGIIPIVCDILKDTTADQKLRIEAIKSLNTFREPATYRVLLDQVKNEMFAETQDEIALLGTEYTLVPLDYPVKVAALLALLEIDDLETLSSLASLFPYFLDAKGEVLLTFLTGFEKSKHKANEDLLRNIAVLITQNNLKIKLKAISIIEKSNQKYLLADLSPALEDKEPKVRLAAVKAIAAIGGPLATPIFIVLLEHEIDPDVRLLTVDTLDKARPGLFQKKEKYLERLMNIIALEKNSNSKAKLKKVYEKIKTLRGN